MAPGETIKAPEPAQDSRRFWERFWVKREMGNPVTDPQTGTSFVLMSEAIWDTAAAALSVLYLLFMLGFLSWALFDIYHGQNQVLAWLFSKETAYPDSPLGRLIAYAVIGGGMGAIIDGFRSFVIWHSERQAFGWRFLWKYITLPPLGGLLAAMVYALVQGGIAILGGGFTPEEGSANQVLSAFGIGALAGYGSNKVFRWLDGHVNRIFSIQKETAVPNLIGLTKDAAVTALEEAGLKAKVKEKSDPANAGKVILQSPKADSKLAPGAVVDITIATP